MRERLILLPLLAALHGCSVSPSVDEIAQEYVDGRRALHTDVSQLSDAWDCQGQSIREWMRRYPTCELAHAWRTICGYASEQTPAYDLARRCDDDDE